MFGMTLPDRGLRGDDVGRINLCFARVQRLPGSVFKIYVQNGSAEGHSKYTPRPIEPLKLGKILEVFGQLGTAGWTH